MKNIIFILLTLFLTTPLISSSTLDADEQSYISVKAKNGDGIFAMLRRYDLQIASCNYQKFLQLNKLKTDSRIYRDRAYLIPILEYSYDGNSIATSINRQDHDLALEIKSYNDRLLSKKLKTVDFINDKSIWVPHHLIRCERTSTVTKPVKAVKKKTMKTEPLFGDVYNRFEVIDQSLKGEVYYVVSGHGGPDPGAIHNAGKSSCMCEDEYAYDVSLRLVRNLKSHGATVHMVIQDPTDGIRDEAHLKCDRDETCLNEGSIPLNQLRRLKQRVKSVNDLYRSHKKKGVKKQKVIAIHVDSRPKGQRQDVFFLYSKGSKQGKKMANNLLDTFAEKYKKNRKHGNYDGEIVERNLYVLRNTSPPAVYVELANIKNPRDRKRITKVSNRQALADWLYEGVIK